MAKEINDAYQMTQILSQLSQYNHMQGNYYASDTCLTRAIKLSRENEFKNELSSYLITLAKNKIANNNTNGVIENLNEATILVNKNKELKTNKMDLYKAFAEYYKLTKNPNMALKYYALYSNIKDTIYNNNVSEKMQQLLAVYEAEKKDKQINILEQQALVKNYEISEQTLLIQRRNLTIIVIIITILLLVIAIALYTRFEKLKNNKKQFALIKETEILERKRIAKDIHDELGSGLTKIKFISEILYQQNKDETLSKNLKTISETVYSLVDNMRDLIWAINPNNTTLDNLLARIREYCSEYIEEIEIGFTFDFPDHIPDEKINNQAHRNIFLTIKEALQNTIKHANATLAKLEIKIDNNILYAKFTDNGRGFNTERNRSLESNGMLNMRHRIETLGGIYNISSKPNEGTTICFEVDFSEIDNKITL